jgi:hypothetical protein
MVLHAMPFERQTRTTFTTIDGSSVEVILLFMSICTHHRGLRFCNKSNKVLSGANVPNKREYFGLNRGFSVPALDKTQLRIMAQAPPRAAPRSVVCQEGSDLQRRARGGAAVMLERSFGTGVETGGCDKTPPSLTPHAAGSALPGGVRPRKMAKVELSGE